ncbi:MAG: hypothetical protein ACPGJS_15115 [Flammeovirgaceae bacterium]
MEISVEKSNWDVRRKITDISNKYFELSMLCMRSDVVCKKFQDPDKAIDFLTTGYSDDEVHWEGCGMKLPKGTKVHFNETDMWATLYLRDKNDTTKVVIHEHPLKLDGSTTTGDEKISVTKSHIKQWSEIDIHVQQKLDKHDCVLVMPWFVPNKDMLWRVEIDGQEEPEILITSSC